MTTATAPTRQTLSWEASIARDAEERLRFVWSEIAARHTSDWVVESDIVSDEAAEAISDRTDAAFRAGFASAAIVARMGYPASNADCEPLLRAIVDASGVAQMPGHIEDDMFVRDGAER